jgi:hypothetical protein
VLISSVYYTVSVSIGVNPLYRFLHLSAIRIQIGGKYDELPMI